ncbi:Flp pilus assembly protein TadB [Paenibacillus sp. LBL]|nr:Flp pilus assembly protein TadB [Paenibacillus sp. LBL]
MNKNVLTPILFALCSVCLALFVLGLIFGENSALALTGFCVGVLALFNPYSIKETKRFMREFADWIK